MKGGKRQRPPRAMLIYCEGKTEEEYFKILLDFYRLPAYVAVKVYGQQGQHLTLVDNAVAGRQELCDELDLSEGEVECWSVCDEDQMPCSFTELERYAEERGVHLAFSAPQFEMYLIQHFEQSSETDRSKVFRQLSRYRNESGAVGEYEDATKADLAWMWTAIDRRPKIVMMAIKNSQLRNRTTKRPFLTVQELTQRILDLSIW